MGYDKKDLKMKTKSLFAIALALFCVSCERNRKEGGLYHIDVGSARVVALEVPDSALLRLESTDKSAISDICNLERIGERYYIHSGGNVRVFGTDGRYCFDIGSMGKASNEYLDISNFYAKGDTICIYDFMSRGLVRYDSEGHFLDRVELPANMPEENVVPNHVYETEAGYVFVNSYGGDYRSVTCLSKTDHAFKSILPVEGRYISSGLTFPDDVCLCRDNVFYWEPLCDTLFVCEGQGIRPYCHLDMGKDGLPYDVTQMDVYGRIDYVNRSHSRGKWVAGAIRYYSAFCDTLFFVFNDRRGGVSVGVMDMKTHGLEVYDIHYKSSSLKTIPFLKIDGNDIYLAAEDADNPDGNPSLVIMDADAFLSSGN